MHDIKLAIINNGRSLRTLTRHVARAQALVQLPILDISSFSSFIAFLSFHYFHSHTMPAEMAKTANQTQNPGL